jgi:hypothetical protein
MGSLFIPPLGTEITLAEDWHFDLYYERRNESLMEVLGISNEGLSWRDYGKNWPVVLSSGTTLKIDRIYIRKSGREFDSVTFFLKGEKTKQKKELRKAVAWSAEVRKEHIYEHTIPARGVRFWAKLQDVNKIIMGE